MKLQLALDVDEKKAMIICEKVAKHIDIIELGTPLVKSSGLQLVKKFKKFRKPILTDLKTMDVGFYESELAFKKGADIVTVCGCADTATVAGAIKSARKYKKKVLVDLISVKNIPKRVKELKKLNPDYFGIHTGIDMQKQGKTPFADLKKLSKLVSTKKIAVAGGINLKTIDKIAEYNPAVIIVGGAITNSKNPGDVAQQLKKSLK